MAEASPNEIQAILQKATHDAEALQARMEAGENVTEEEMTAVAKAVAEAIEEANAKLRAMIGPMDTALLREKIVENMTPEEFEQWTIDNAALQEYKAHKAKEKSQDG